MFLSNHEFLVFYDTQFLGLAVIRLNENTFTRTFRTARDHFSEYFHFFFIIFSRLNIQYNSELHVFLQVNGFLKVNANG